MGGQIQSLSGGGGVFVFLVQAENEVPVGHTPAGQGGTIQDWADPSTNNCEYEGKGVYGRQATTATSFDKNNPALENRKVARTLIQSQPIANPSFSFCVLASVVTYGAPVYTSTILFGMPYVHAYFGLA